MKTERFYLHISSKALPHYILAGCIKASSFFEKRSSDLQSEFPDEIVLSSKMWNTDNDCSIEIILKEHELNTDIKQQDYLLYNGIIPISRITAINFSNKEEAEQVLWNIENGAGFVPKHLIHFLTKDTKSAARVQGLKSTITEEQRNLTKKVSEKYNRLLGGLAFLRTALSDINDRNINYPENFLATVSFFNSQIENELIKNKLKVDVELHSLLNGKSPFFKFLGKQITEDLLIETALKENISLEKRFGNFKIENIPSDSITYRLAVLHTYGNSRVKNIEDLLSSFFNELNSNEKEELALIFGINNGYIALRNYYKINNRHVHVKFEMDSKLDYIIVEAVYNFVTNDHEKLLKIEYLEEIFNNLPQSDGHFLKGYSNFRVLDKVITTKPKDYSENLDSLIKLLSNEVSSWFPFKISQPELVKRLNTVLKTKFNDTVSDIKIDVEEELANTLKSEESFSTKKELKEENLVETVNEKQEEKLNDLNEELKKELKAMKVPDLKELAISKGITVPPKTKKDPLIDIILKYKSEKNRLF